MPDVLRYIGETLPVTFPAQAMRAVMARGTYNLYAKYKVLNIVCGYVAKCDLQIMQQLHTEL